MRNSDTNMSTKSNQNQTASEDYHEHIHRNSKHNVEELLHTWTTYSKSVNSDNLFLIGVAGQICLSLSRSSSYSALEVFLNRLPEIPAYSKNQDVLRAKLSLALHKRQTDIVQDIIKNNVFEETEDIIKVWDEANYIEEEERLQKPLTPLARFRVRKRHPPPPTICPSGIRKTSSLPKAATKTLREWLIAHFTDPYPSGEEKMALAKMSGLTPNQVKTWFANARRRIHKGAESIVTKHNHHHDQAGSEMRPYDSYKYENPLLRKNFADGVPISKQQDMGSSDMSSWLFQNGQGEYGCHPAAGNECDRASMPSFRCVHALHNAYSCVHCQAFLPQNNVVCDDYMLNAARFGSYAANGGFGMHPTPGYFHPRWPYLQPNQYNRFEEFDNWHKEGNIHPVAQGRITEEDNRGTAVRLNTLENGLTTMGMMNQYMANEALLEKVPEVASSKDELTEVGAARILADLSSKENWSLPTAYSVDAS